MKSSLVVSVLGLLTSLLVLTGCVSSGGGNAGPVNKYSTACMFEVNPPGSYVWTDSDTMVKPGGGGTAEGAAALNDCIQRKAAAAGETVVTGQAAQSRQVVEVEQTGGQVVETFTYGSPPVAATSAEPDRRSAERCRTRNVLSGGSGYNGCVK